MKHFYCTIIIIYVIENSIFVTEHEKTGLMYTKYIYLYYGTYLLYCLRYLNSVNCIRFTMKWSINGGNAIRLLFLSAKLLKFEIQKCGQILCAHKPYFLMPGHILALFLRICVVLVWYFNQPFLLVIRHGLLDFLDH